MSSHTSTFGQAGTDWEGVERDYRAGVLSTREIGRAHGVSHTAIRKRAERDGWERDLRAKVQAKAEAKVAKAAVSREVSAASKATEATIVEANAEVIARVRLAHRTDISKARSLAMRLLAELEAQTEDNELFEQLATLLREADKDSLDKLNDVYRKVISLPARVSNLKALAESLKNLIGLERQAHGLDDGARGDAPDSWEARARSLSDAELDREIAAQLPRHMRPH